MSTLRKFFRRLFGRKEIDRAVENADTTQDEAPIKTAKEAAVKQGTELPKTPPPVLNKDSISSSKTELRAGAEGEQRELPLFSERLNPATDGTTPSETDPPSSGDEDTFVIGVDFGTAFTKVVVGDGVGVRHWAVPVDQEQPRSYLFPGTLSINKGSAALGEGSGRNFDDIKLCLIKDEMSSETAPAAAAYLALILKRTRAFLVDEKIWSPRRSNPVWYINIGLPTGSYSKTNLTDLYIKITSAAWIASFSEKPITLDLTQELLNSVPTSWSTLVPEANDQELVRDPGTIDDTIHVFPEFVAQLAGYVRDSPQREDGLHLLLDVGSGTVDCSAFNIKKYDGENSFEILAKSVELTGVRFLQKARMDYPGAARWLPKLTEDQPDDREYAKRLGIAVADLQIFDTDFFDKFFKQIGAAMNETKRGGKVATGPDLGVPIFLCGGGSRYQGYNDVLMRFKKRGEKAGAWRVYKKRIDLPHKLRAPDLSTSDYDRLSVAYGLSFFPYNLGEIVRAQEQDSPAPPTVDESWRDRYIDKDQI